MEEESSATDSVTDLTDGRGKFGNGFCDGCNGWMDGRGKREEGKSVTYLLLNDFGVMLNS